MSLWFYAYLTPRYLWIIIISVLMNYLCYWCINKSDSHKLKKAIMIIGVTINIGILFYYKYFDFFLDNVNAVFGTNYPMLNIMLPLGISFFTFQQISFLVDRYHQKAPAYGFLDYACFRDNLFMYFDLTFLFCTCKTANEFSLPLCNLISLC